VSKKSGELHLPGALALAALVTLGACVTHLPLLEPLPPPVFQPEGARQAADTAADIAAAAELNWEILPGGTGVVVTGFTGTGAHAHIPARIQRMPVTAIGPAAFLMRGLTSVSIPNSVTSIGAMAFASNQLTSVTIPPGVTSIGSTAFANNRLTRVDIPPTVTSVGYRAFWGNQIAVVVVPASVVSVGDDAFGDAVLARPDGTPVLLADLQQDAAGGVPPAPVAAAREHRAVVIGGRNWLSAEAALGDWFDTGTDMGGGIRYTRDINHFFSVGAAAFFHGIFYNDGEMGPAREIAPFCYGAMATALFFPGHRSIFYLEIGMGWGRGLTGFGSGSSGGGGEIWSAYYVTGFTVAPGIGWRLGGRAGGFFVNPFISMPIVLGEQRVRRTAPDPPRPDQGGDLSGRDLSVAFSDSALALAGHGRAVPRRHSQALR